MAAGESGKVKTDAAGGSASSGDSKAGGNVNAGSAVGQVQGMGASEASPHAASSHELSLHAESPRAACGLSAAVYWLCAVALAAVFIYAGVVKLLDPAGFLSDINNYRLLPAQVAQALAVVLPPLEVVLGGALLLRPLAKTAAAVLFVLCAVFLVAIVSAWARGLDITCGCFGSAAAAAPRTSYVTMIVRDLFFMALAVGVWFSGIGRRRRCAPGGPSRNASQNRSGNQGGRG